MSKTACKHNVYPEQGCRVCELEFQLAAAERERLTHERNYIAVVERVTGCKHEPAYMHPTDAACVLEHEFNKQRARALAAESALRRIVDACDNCTSRSDVVEIAVCYLTGREGPKFYACDMERKLQAAEAALERARRILGKLSRVCVVLAGEPSLVLGKLEQLEAFGHLAEWRAAALSPSAPVITEPACKHGALHGCHDPLCPRCGGKPSAPCEAEPKGAIGGEVLYCSKCGRGVVLPYVDGDRRSVSIVPIEGWASPPLLCPRCQPSAPKQPQEKFCSICAGVGRRLGCPECGKVGGA